jgi:hypothetical protein
LREHYALTSNRGEDTLRHWQLDTKKPLSLHLAADARLTQTDYTDDQSWLLRLGAPDEAALMLTTAYGGRANAVSLVPMWTTEGRTVYQPPDYHTPPVVTGFAPGFTRAEGAVLPDLTFQAVVWAADSHSLTGAFKLTNSADTPQTIRLDLYGHILWRNRELQVAVMTLASDENALYLGHLGNIDPVVLVKGGKVGVGTDGHIRPQVGRNLTVEPGGSVTLRWAHVALPEQHNSLRRARYWLEQDLSAALAQVNEATAALPQIETGDTALDATLAFGVQHAVSAFLRPTDHLPHPSFVAAREYTNGYSAKGDGSDMIRAWSGQQPTAAYLLASALAGTEPAFAEGVIRNYINIMAEDGFIDWAPGLGGQRHGQLALPVLARLAWRVYEAGTGNYDFIAEIYPALTRFFNRWFAADVDRDGEGIPEWATVAQTGYAGWPLFSDGGVDITTVEGPDMVAYLLSEATHLRHMAELLGEDPSALTPRIDELRTALSELWQDGAFVYRDRDTHITPARVTVLDSARADEIQFPALSLEVPARLVVEAVGGASNKPALNVTLIGLDADGNAVTETLDTDAFTWGYRRGSATSRTVFTQIDKIKPGGLSRVFRLNAYTTDLAANDANTVLPLITDALNEEQVTALVTRIQNTLLRPNGLALYPPPTVPGADPSGVWVYWNALLCEGLFAHGHAELAVDVLRRLLRVQTATLRESGVFTVFYDEDDMRGMGTRLDLNGLPPLHLLMTAIGITIQADGMVNVLPDFPWGEPITITQYGIRVERDTTQTTVTTSDGTRTVVPAGTGQTVAPSIPVTRPAPLDLPAKPELTPAEPPPMPIKIEVEIDNPDAS